LSLLTIAQDAASKIGLRRPASVLASSDREVIRLLNCIKEECVDLVESAYWEEIRAEQTFTAIAGSVQTGILPSDYNRMVPETFWDRSNARLITNVASAVEWQNLKAIGYLGPEYKFTVRGGSLYILPEMAGGETLAFEYISNNYILAGSTPQATFTADTNTLKIDEPLVTLGSIWRFKGDIGQPFAADFEKYRIRRELLLGNNEPQSGTMLSADIFGGGRAWGGAPTAGGIDLYR